jgi:transketolase
MRKFRIDEISSVDRPAQVGARAVIMKRAPLPSENDETHGWLAEEGRRLRAQGGGPDIDEIDQQLMEMAREARKAGETTEQAYARMAKQRETSDTEFTRLLHERMRA